MSERTTHPKSTDAEVRGAAEARLPAAAPTRWYRRFDAFDRVLHAVLMLSFLGLASTGLPLLFSDERWAAVVARAQGGFVVAGVLHRTFAVLLIVCFATHLGRVLRRILVKKELGLLWGPGSLIPQPRDLIDLYRHTRWFVGLGPCPSFGRFTYWEKFDYWAVFWGMGIIGGSGLILWFPEAATLVLPGWALNVAMVVHSEEALLAVGFIFTIHFFNSHLRPEKFPMDLVIFTGRISEEELRHERPEEYLELVQKGRLEAIAVPPAERWLIRFSRTIGTAAVTLGLIVVSLIIYALVS